jgi:hypothetical protein
MSPADCSPPAGSFPCSPCPSCWPSSAAGRTPSRPQPPESTAPEPTPALATTTTQPRRLKPAAVAGGLQFGGVSPGGDHTCGVTTDKRAYCWGGLLGDGTLNVFSSTSVVVAGAM